MKRLKSLGSGRSKTRAESAAKSANQSASGQWPSVSAVPEEQATPAHSPFQAQSQGRPADTYVNFSDDEIRAMEDSALEYAIQQSQQSSDRYLNAHIALSFPIAHTTASLSFPYIAWSSN